MNIIKRDYFLHDKKLNFKFFQNVDDFIVEEEPIGFSSYGNFLVLKVKKQNCDTWELLDRFSKHLGVFSNELGYAGLKDKNATTTQYITIPKKYQKEIKTFRSKKIEILDSFLHNKKLNIGDLNGNRFKINLKEVELEELFIIEKVLKLVNKFGMPNYFGYQRFGKDVEDNLEKAKDLLFDESKIKDRKLAKMLISAYQSSYFNAWLKERLKLNKEDFTLLDGDVFFDIKNNKLFTPKNINKKIIDDFKNHDITPTGLLPGTDVFKARDDALLIEQKYDNSEIREKGYRREAIIFPKILDTKYNKDKKELLLDFILPKGSYATVLIELLANRNFS
ncbi:tRNA pseudouridine(13) synthase TruD [Arcobacter porcinus]|uniref:tRNA pseudouridine synthase D n=1 Tax=Arcobacter porcinus TaxID=1935204 RepID=A0A5C2HL46_9BACT|nr:tRNA pseudouridine(13) synthase TruD [Arcobacter porcinus]OCL94548.1 tRNA pseudouridine synthase D [Aliarcobacter thereius]QEP41460.1 tRNA pseudouridine 13 synthase [Arcobacter porcinus]